MGQPRITQLYESAQSGQNVVNKFGRNLTIAASSATEVIWTDGGATYPFQTSPQLLEIVSSSGSDVALGVGGRTIQVFGLDSNWLPISEIKTLTGATEVNLDNTYIRVLRAKILEVGTTGVNVGKIDIQIQGGGTILATIEAGLGQTLMAVYSTGANETGYLKQIFSSIVRTTTVVRATMQLVVREFELSMQVKRTYGLIDSSPYLYNYYGALLLPPKTDIWLEKTFASGVSSISGSFDIRSEYTY